MPNSVHRVKRPGRVIGVDLGTKRIGIATSDTSGTLASPLVVLLRCGSQQRDHRAIQDIVVEYEAEHVVVGLPLSLDGSIGKAAQAALAEIKQMAKTITVPITAWDERLSTVTAHEKLMEQRMRAEARRRIVDKIAAAVLLQGWLDYQGELASATEAHD